MASWHWGVIFVLARLGSAHGSGYIVQYRSSLGVDAFEQGTVSGILIFLHSWYWSLPWRFSKPTGV